MLRVCKVYMELNLVFEPSLRVVEFEKWPKLEIEWFRNVKLGSKPHSENLPNKI